MVGTGRRAAGPGRWARRVLLWPAVVLGVPLLVALAPALFAAAAGIDLLTGPRRLRAIRLTAMALNYIVLEWVGLVAGAVLWVITAGGLLHRRRWSQRLHHLVQMWWARAVMAAAGRWLGARWRIDGGESTDRGPMIVAARHTSFFDAVVPSLVIGEHPDIHLRHVLKAELVWDPCLDLYGHRLPNHFVARASFQRAGELAAIGAMGADLGADAAIIFPEGTFRTQARADTVMRRLAQREPDRADRLTLRHLLPPQLGGLCALMAAAPEADLVFIAHRGFEPFGSFRSILANVPFQEPIEIKVWRVPAADVPADGTGRHALLDHWWQQMDDWIEEAG